MPNQFDKDRLFAQGLPSSLSSDALERIANPPKDSFLRVASHIQAIQDGFEPIPEAEGLYRKAHNIWALQPAEQGEGYVLVRLHEERDVDCREASSKQASITQQSHDNKADVIVPICGQRVAFVHKGQLAEAMVVFVHPSCELVDLALRGPEPKAEAEIIMAVPTNQLMQVGEPTVELTDEDPFAPASIPKGF